MRNFAIGITLSILSIILTLFALELGARLVKGIPLTKFTNFVEDRITVQRQLFPTQYDPYQGWIPKTGAYGKKNYWGKSITILDYGIRYNGQESNGQDSLTILAIGDSFTYGDEVANDETWPSRLEELSKIKVVNGGVFGYGLDQSIIRAERLADIFNPSIIIISFISDDIDRTEYSKRWGLAKPYFGIIDGKLKLRNSPVPYRPPTTDIDLFRKIFGYSFLLDRSLDKLGLAPYWYIRDWDNKQRAHTEGEEVSCLLMGRLSELSISRKTRVILLAQYTEPEINRGQPSNSEKIIACAKQKGIAVLDLYSYLEAVATSDPEKIKSFFLSSHMSEEGNQFVAKKLFEFLKRNNFASEYNEAQQNSAMFDEHILWKY